jgi:hypothetical protein
VQQMANPAFQAVDCSDLTVEREEEKEEER